MRAELYADNPYVRELPPPPDPTPESNYEAYFEWMEAGCPPQQPIREYVVRTRCVARDELPALPELVHVTGDVSVGMVDQHTCLVRVKLARDLAIERFGLILVHDALTVPSLVIEDALRPRTKLAGQGGDVTFTCSASCRGDAAADPSCQDTRWFWEVVDREGLANVPSTERDALRVLVGRAAQRDRLAAMQPMSTAPRDRGILLRLKALDGSEPYESFAVAKYAEWGRSPRAVRRVWEMAPGECVALDSPDVLGWYELPR